MLSYCGHRFGKHGFEKNVIPKLDTTHGYARRLRRGVHCIFISSNFSLKFSPDIPKTTSVKKTQKSKNQFFYHSRCIFPLKAVSSISTADWVRDCPNAFRTISKNIKFFLCFFLPISINNGSFLKLFCKLCYMNCDNYEYTSYFRAHVNNPITFLYIFKHSSHFFSSIRKFYRHEKES